MRKIKTFILIVGVVLLAQVVFGNPYPNPWRYGENNTAEGGMNIAFPATAKEATLYIYNFAGELVYKYNASSADISRGFVTWKGVNNHNKLVSSGTYFLVLKVKYTSGKTDYLKTKIVFVRKGN